MYVYILDEKQEHELLWFAPNQGVTVKPAILKESPERMRELLDMAFFFNNNVHLKDACQGGRGPLMDRFGYMAPVSFDELLGALDEIRVQEETKRAKRRITGRRRSEFQSERARLALRMINNGIPYVCALADCAVTEDLTIDHVEPLSRGGTDSIENLQFLCRSHNSQKGDKVAA